MTSNQFTETYKKLPNEKLIDILDNRKDYQSLAIETALEELKFRQLTDEQITNARQVNKERRNRKAISEEEINKKIQIAKKSADQILVHLDPLVEKTPERNLKVISLVLALLAVVKILSNFSFFIFLFEDSNWDFSIVPFLFDLLFLPTSLVQFWRKKKSGRIMLSVWLVFNSISAIILFTILFSTSSIPQLAFLLPKTDLSTFTFTILLSVALLYYINKKEIRKLFQ